MTLYEAHAHGYHGGCRGSGVQCAFLRGREEGQVTFALLARFTGLRGLSYTVRNLSAISPAVSFLFPILSYLGTLHAADLRGSVVSVLDGETIEVMAYDETMVLP